jgi:hypothetical protein
MDADVAPPTAFQFLDPGAGPGAADVLPVWTVVTPPVAFVAPAAAGAAGGAPRWLADLPAAPGPAAEVLAQGASRLEAWQEALPAAAERLGAFTTAYAAGAAFAPAPALAPAAEPEAELALLLAEVREAAGPPSFGPRQWLLRRWQAVTDRFQAFLRPVLRSLTHFAWVETVVGGRELARTAVTWKGSFLTAWRADGVGARALLHERALDLALASRATWVRVLLLALGGAARVAALLALPGGFLLALPAVWNFIHRIGTELGTGRRAGALLTVR